jgi:hypothetical protein
MPTLTIDGHIVRLPCCTCTPHRTPGKATHALDCRFAVTLGGVMEGMGHEIPTSHVVEYVHDELVPLESQTP